MLRLSQKKKKKSQNMHVEVVKFVGLRSTSFPCIVYILVLYTYIYYTLYLLYKGTHVHSITWEIQYYFFSISNIIFSQDHIQWVIILCNNQLYLLCPLWSCTFLLFIYLLIMIVVFFRLFWICTIISFFKTFYPLSRVLK